MKLREAGAQLAVVDVSDPFTPSYIADIVEAAGARYVRLENVTSSDLYEEISKLFA